MTALEIVEEQGVRLLQELQEQRRIASNEAAANAASRFLRDTDRIESPESSVVQATAGWWLDSALSPRELMSYQALGVAPNTLLAEPSNVQEPAVVALVAPSKDESFEVRRRRNGISTRYTSASPGASSTPSNEIVERVRQRFASSPAHAEMHALRQRHAQSEAGSHAETATGWFSPMEDALGTLEFLTDINFRRTSDLQTAEAMRNGATPQALIAETFVQAQQHHAIQVTRDTHFTRYEWGSGVVCGLVVDNESGNFQFTLRQRPEDYYNEIANNQPEVQAIPFVETECAAQLCGWLDENGLTFSSELLQAMNAIGPVDRFGGVYTQMSREVAKWINSPERIDLSRLFTVRDTHQDADEMVRKALLAADVQQFSSGAAAMLVGLAKAVVTRDRSQEYTTELPVTKKTIHIKDGGCFDVVDYYVAAAEDASWKRELRSVVHGSVTMLEKTQGSHTFLLQQDTLFNGIRLPKGALLSKAPDGGYAVLRLTPFTFDKAADQLAMGSELTKAYAAEKSYVRRFGQITLSGLLEAAQLYK